MDNIAKVDLFCIVAGSALVGFAFHSVALGFGVLLLAHAIRPFRT